MPIYPSHFHSFPSIFIPGYFYPSDIVVPHGIEHNKTITSLFLLQIIKSTDVCLGKESFK